MYKIFLNACLALAISPCMAFADTVTYDYANRTPGTNIFAYYGQISSTPPTNNITPSNEFSSYSYTKIKTKDDSYSHNSTSSNSRYASQRFVMKIDASKSSVSKITINWDGVGYQLKTNKWGSSWVTSEIANLYIWNYTSSAYEYIGNTGYYWPTNLNTTISNNVSNYIGGYSDDTITLLAVATAKANGNNKSSHIKTDYISVGITASSKPNLIANYRFDECQYTGSGSEVIDSIDNHSATSHGAVNTFDAGQIQRALELTDKDQHIETNIPLSANFSVSTWFKKPTSNTNNRNFVLGAMKNGGDLLYLDRNKNWRWGVYARGDSTDGTFSFGTLDNNWHHMVLVYSGGATQLYIDGIYKDSVNRAPTGTLKFIGTSFDDVTSNSPQGFRSPLDEFMVFDSVLTINQIKNIYDNQKAKKNYDNTERVPLNCGASSLIEWDMDEKTWNGASNEVIDSSGNHNHGTAKNGLSTTHDLFTCRAGEFDGKDDYIHNEKIDDILRDTASMSFWIKTSQTGNNTAWSAPGISGVEQAGGTDDIFWGWIDTSGHIGISVGDDNLSKSASVINDGAFHHIVLTRDAMTGAYKIYIDGSLDKSGTTGTGVIGTTFRSIGRIEGGNGYFKGLLDELKIYSGVLSKDQVEDLYKQPATCNTPQIDHYEIIHDGSGLTCEAEAVTVKACTNQACSTLSNKSITLDLQAKGSTLSSQTFTGSGQFSFNHTQAETLTLSVANPTTSAVNALVCSGGDGASCDIVFADTGFRFLVDNKPDNIRTQLSGKPSNTGYHSNILSLQAIKTNLETGACEAALTSDVNIEMAAQCKNPIACAGQKVSINSSEIPTLDSKTALSYSNVPLNFGSSSENSAAFVFTYPDAGQMQLYARYNIPVNGVPSGNYMSGSSNIFVVKPFGFYIKLADTHGAENAVSNVVFKKAGEKFSATLTAMQWQDGDDKYDDGQPESNSKLSDNSATVNFGKESPKETVLVSSTLLLPKGGNNPALLNSTFSNFTNGVSKRSDLSWAEVGIIQLNAKLNYLGAGDVTGKVPYVGRFTPDHFDLTIPENGNGVLNGGNPFAYSGQMRTTTDGQISYATPPKFTITAKSLGGSTTKNYTDKFIKIRVVDEEDKNIHNLPVEPISDSTHNGVDKKTKLSLTANLNTATLVGSNGVLQYQFNSTDNYVYTRNANAIIKPFTADIDLQITSITDDDGIKAKDANDKAAGVLTLQPTGVEIRFGRWFMENAYGPEISNLRIPMQLQYWDGSHFATNDKDSFTRFDSKDVTIKKIDLTGVKKVPGSGHFINGKTQALTLKTPGTGNRGAVKLEFNVPAWLKYDWSNTDTKSNGPYNENPSAQANFGLYRGNDRIIYRRESFK